MKIIMVRKYFLSTLKFARGNAKMNELRKLHKAHRGAAEFEVDHSKKAYNRFRI